MFRSLYLTVLVAAIVAVLVLSMLSLAGFPPIDLLASIDNPLIDFGVKADVIDTYPTPVGGYMTPINKPAIIAIYLVLLGLVAVVSVASLITARGKKLDN